MDLDTFKPTFLIQIEGQTLAKDITQEIMAFAFTDNEDEMDVLELRVTNRNLQFVDDPLFQEGNEIVARFGYVGALSPRRKAVIKDIDYDFPDNDAPSIRLKAYDKGFRLAGRENQKVWQRPAPGILDSEIAEAIAHAHGLTPRVRPTQVRRLRVAQSNLSDAQFLRELAARSRSGSGSGAAGYVFYVQDDELHFRPRDLHQAPALSLEYFTDRRGLLRAFRPSTQSQGAKGAGTETRAIGVDPRRKAAVEHRANNATTGDRTSLGRRTYLVDGNTGEGAYRPQETGQVVPSYERSEAFAMEPDREPARDVAEGRFQDAELRQVEAVAVTMGIPSLRAKQNIDIQGVGRKFSGVYYCHSVRHCIDGSGYWCELRLKKNALGRGAGAKSDAAQGRHNDLSPPARPSPDPPAMIIVDGETGAIKGG